MKYKKELRSTYIGVLIALITFVVIGAIPGLTYGGYIGLIMLGAMFGTPVVGGTLLAKVFIGGGMAIGLFATLSLFLVMGAFISNLVSLLFNAIKSILIASEEGKVRVF